VGAGGGTGSCEGSWGTGFGVTGAAVATSAGDVLEEMDRVLGGGRVTSLSSSSQGFIDFIGRIGGEFVDDRGGGGRGREEGSG
jgi:hypothetical protein